MNLAAQAGMGSRLLISFKCIFSLDSRRSLPSYLTFLLERTTLLASIVEKYMKNKKRRIKTILSISFLFVISAAIVLSLLGLKNNKTMNSSARGPKCKIVYCPIGGVRSKIDNTSRFYNSTHCEGNSYSTLEDACKARRDCAKLDCGYYGYPGKKISNNSRGYYIGSDCSGTPRDTMAKVCGK